jgi:glutamine synthetase
MNFLTAEEASSGLDEFFNKHPKTEFVRVYWLDFSARLRVKVLTRTFCQDLASQKGSFLTATANSLNKIVDTSAIGGGSKFGTDEIYPDWQSLRPCPHFPGHASVLTTVRHIGDDFESCPRTTLRRMMMQLKELSITTAVGFEVELAILEGSPSNPQSIEIETGWLDSAVFRSKYLSLLEEMVLALQASDIPVREFHPEGGSKGKLLYCMYFQL